jgi:hypothetical protein
LKEGRARSRPAPWGTKRSRKEGAARAAPPWEVRNVLKGLLASGVTLSVAAVFPQHLVLPLLLAVMGLMSGAFPGSAMVSEGGRPTLQWAAAVALVGLGAVGLWLSPLYLAGAWLLHCSWSLLHQVTSLGDGVAEGLPPFSSTFGLVMAGFVAYLWLAGW